MFHQRIAPHRWTPYLGNALILLATHIVVATLQSFVALPAHARLMYLVSTLLLVFIVVDDLHWRLVYEESTPTPRPLPLVVMSVAVITDYYVAALYILRSDLFALGFAMLLGTIIFGSQRWFMTTLHTACILKVGPRPLTDQ